MSTRAAAKRLAAVEKTAQSLSSPPVTPGTDNEVDMPSAGTIASSAVTTKRKRAPTGKKATMSMKVDWSVLPHGLGKKGDLENGFEAAKEEDTAPRKRAYRTRASIAKDVDTVMVDDKPEVKLEDDEEMTGEVLKDVKPKLGWKRKAVEVRDGEGDFKDENVEGTTPTKKRATRKQSQPKKPRQKKHPYGLTPGVSPFPDLAKPTREDCEEVNRLLSELHGEIKAPEVIPAPSMEVTGCGEVPDLLDALLRTLLSAATTSKNSNMALQGLKDAFGLRTSGVGKGSINWEAVREADLDKVIDAIKSGGLAKNKGTNIKRILDAVYQSNLVRFNALKKEKETGEPAQVLGAKHETQKQKDQELAEFKDTMLSLDYLFELTTDEVMDELTKLPGIGVKTSSCVILFCMKRPSFAVDTHVWRHCKWLGWVPEKASRDKTFSHLEVRIPNELKYALHQLFISHGKKCPRCRANTGPGSEGWEDCECPIEHLVKRTGKMKSKAGKPDKPGKKAKDDEDEDEDVNEDDINEDEEE